MRAHGTLILIATVILSGSSWRVQPAAAEAEAAVTEGVKIDGEYGYGLPPDISEHGAAIDRLIHWVHWFMGLLFVGWGIYFVYCLLKFRQCPGHKATYELIKAKPTKYVEIGVVVFEAVLLIGLSMPAWASLKNELPDEADNPVRVRVLAEQFAWNFHYPGADGVFGRTGAEHIDSAVNPVGIDPSDPNGQDDVVAGEFHIPIDEPVICELASKDVIHSFALTVMRVKQDVIPGMRIPVWFKAKKTGTYEVACAQLCGNNHYKMKALMIVETREEFDAWLKKKAVVEEFDEDEFDD